MVRSALLAAAMIALCVSATAIGLFSSPLHQMSPMTPTQAVQELLPLAAMAAHLTAVASIFRQLRHPNYAAAAAGAGTYGTGAAAGVMCGAVGVLQYLLHDDDGTRPRAVGAAAAHVLPAAATATFFLGMALVFVHGSGASPGDGAPVQAPVRILIKLALGAAAIVIGLMALSLYP